MTGEETGIVAILCLIGSFLFFLSEDSIILEILLSNVLVWEPKIWFILYLSGEVDVPESMLYLVKGDTWISLTL